MRTSGGVGFEVRDPPLISPPLLFFSFFFSPLFPLTFRTTPYTLGSYWILGGDAVGWCDTVVIVRFRAGYGVTRCPARDTVFRPLNFNLMTVGQVVLTFPTGSDVPCVGPCGVGLVVGGGGGMRPIAGAPMGRALATPTTALDSSTAMTDRGVGGGAG